MKDFTNVPAVVTITNNNAAEVTIPLYRVYNEVIVPAGGQVKIVAETSAELVYYADTLKIKGVVVEHVTQSTALNL